MASIVLDDTTPRLKQGGVEWLSEPDLSMFGGASTWPDVSDPPKKYGTFNVSFEGTSIALSGWVGHSHGSAPSAFLVSIDGSRPRETSYQSGSIEVHQWYQTPQLSDGAHVLNISRFPENIEIDYMVVTAGQKTPLLGERLIVDDIDPAIVYHGQWDYQDFSSYQTKSGDDSYLLYPHGNGTHRTTAAGSGATFHFIGTLVSVYGVFNWNAPCSMSVKYTVDDFSTTKNYSVVGTQNYNDRTGDIGHTLLFASDILPAGQHVLDFELVTISPNADSNDFSLSFDYILYSPSVNSLAELGTFQTFTTSSSPTGAVTAVPQPNINHSRKVAGIAGGIVGGLAILAVLLLIAFRLRTRSRQRRFSRTEGDPVIRGDIMMPVPRHQSVAPFTFLENTSSTLKRPRSPDAFLSIPPSHPLSVPTSQANSIFGHTSANGTQDAQPSDSPYSHNPALKEYITEFTSKHPLHPTGESVSPSPPPGYRV